MSDRFAAKLASLGFRLPHWCDPPSETLVAAFEREFSVTLPADYREFLLNHGGVTGGAVCPFQELTPVGPDTIIDCFFGFGPPERGEHIAGATRLIDGAPSVIAIGNDCHSGMFWLICDGEDAGHVYLHDGEGRSTWPDDMFYGMYSNLSPSIEQYLTMRRRKRLPQKPRGYEHIYRVGQSFAEFFDALQPNHYYSNSEAPASFWTRTTAWLAPMVRKITFGIWPAEDPGVRWARIRNRLLACDESLLQEIIRSGKLNAPMDYGGTPLQNVAESLKALTWLANAGADLRGALGSAAASGAPDSVRFLLEKGCAVDERCGDKTPLMASVEFHYLSDHPSDIVEVARILINAGADVNATSDDGQSVLRIAGGERYSNGRPKGQPELIELLEAAGARLDPSKVGE